MSAAGGAQLTDLGGGGITAAFGGANGDNLAGRLARHKACKEQCLLEFKWILPLAKKALLGEHGCLTFS